MGEVKWSLVGENSTHNGLMAIAAARHVGVAPADAANALGSLIKLVAVSELRGEANGVTVYDDFAHHPTAILATLAVPAQLACTVRTIAVLEPRLNTMKMGICKDDLAPSLGRADEVFLPQPTHIPWQVRAEAESRLTEVADGSGDVDTLADMVVKTAQPGDHILVMSNGGFGGFDQKLLDGLAKKAEAAQ